MACSTRPLDVDHRRGIGHSPSHIDSSMPYLAYGLAIESDVPLGVPTTDREPETTVVARQGAVDQSAVRWFERVEPPDDDWFFGGRLGDDYYLLFDEEAEFVLSADGSTVSWFSFTEVSSTLIHLLLDHVIPRALNRQGRSAVHGSCLAYRPDRCFAIVGESGRGKSTLASALVARGYRFVADDCVVIDVIDGRPLARAAYPELRLGAESVTVAGFDGLVATGDVTREGTKRRHAVPVSDGAGGSGTDGSERYLLTTVFTLRAGGLPDASDASDASDIGADGADPAEALVSAPLGPARAAVELLSNSFQLNDVDEQTVALVRVAEIAEACDVHKLAYEHSADGLTRTLAAIEEFLSIDP